MTTQDMLDERYGRASSPRRRWTIGIVIAIAAVVVGLFAWMTVASTLDDVHVDTTGFTVDDPRTVTLAFQITAPAGRSVACALEAQDEEHGIVGWKIVELPASELRERAFREVIPTTAEATTGLVNACWVT
ncbi:protein of unknown function [Microbacterium sp. cf046]|uniref:DUF4307 domain-containing protein n=1 Tax=Microbacterium sp. cf046 TaxID=1761803 RepID=UPI0008ED5B8A|nr:DUF4307 domain-containing protein [Microbacterium sp. cf046]SFS08677.1 protein of unknown function [Microbacterium sp. cf046]